MVAKPILYYTPASPPNRTVLLVARELGLDLDLKLVDLMKGEQNTPEFKKMNPQHTVPTLDDNGKYLWDSNAISTYLIEKYGKTDNHPLYPTDLYIRARINQRLQFNGGIIFPVLAGLIRPVLREGATGFSEKSVQAAHEAFQFLEIFLADATYLVGDHLTVADLAIAPALTQINTHLPIEASKYPKINAWLKRLEKMPNFHEINSSAVDNFRVWFAAALERNRAAKH